MRGDTRRRRRAGLTGILRGAALALALAALGGPATTRAQPDGRDGRDRPDGRDAPDAQATAPDPGSALRTAVAAQRSGDLDAALGAFREIARTQPVIADYADLLRVRALAEAERHGEVIVAADEANARSPTSPLRSDWMRLSGDAHAALGAGAEARSAWQGALDATRDPARGARLREKISLSLASAGDPHGAAALDREIWERTPTDPAARRAAERIDTAERTLEEPARSAQQWDGRAQRLFDAGWSQEALAATDVALARGLEGPAGRAAEQRRAQCLFRLRRYAEAAQAFGALGDAGDAAIFRARAIARGGDVAQGVRLLLALAESEGAGSAAQARWYAGLLLDGEGEAARAGPLFEAVAQQGAEPALAASALWRIAWSDFRDGAHARARVRLLQLADAGGELFTRLQARYWAARAAEESGDTAAAQREYARLAGEWGLSYYGWRARARVRDPAAIADVCAAAPGGASQLDPAELARPRILLEAELRELAREEIVRLAAGEGTARPTPAPADRLALAELAVAAGDYAQSQSLVLVDWSEALQRCPAPGGDEPFRLAYPLAYAELVQAATPALETIPRGLVFAIMREESGYRPSAVSVVGARGLMQIMPETADRLARQGGLGALAPDDLFDPAVNVRLGAAYLDALGGRFGGRLSAAIGSYNAGPEAVARWLAARPEWADDAWVEEIPYDQTRNYVKRVLRSLHIYEVLYQP